MEAEQQVNVVTVSSKLLDSQFVAQLYFMRQRFDCHGNLRLQQSFAILDRKDHVVVGVVGAVEAFGR